MKRSVAPAGSHAVWLPGFGAVSPSRLSNRSSGSRRRVERKAKTSAATLRRKPRIVLAISDSAVTRAGDSETPRAQTGRRICWRPSETSGVRTRPASAPRPDRSEASVMQRRRTSAAFQPHIRSTPSSRERVSKRKRTNAAATSRADMMSKAEKPAKYAPKSRALEAPLAEARS